MALAPVVEQPSAATSEPSSNNTPHLIPDDDALPPAPATALLDATDSITMQPGRAPRQPPPTAPTVVPVDNAPISKNTRHRARRRPVQQQANGVIDTTTGKNCKYRQLAQGKVPGHPKERWIKSYANELCRLADGNGSDMQKGTNTIRFISHQQLPAGRFPTYGRLVVSVRPNKDDMYRVRLTVGGDKVNYPF